MYSLYNLWCNLEYPSRWWVKFYCEFVGWLLVNILTSESRCLSSSFTQKRHCVVSWASIDWITLKMLLNRKVYRSWIQHTFSVNESTSDRNCETHTTIVFNWVSFEHVSYLFHMRMNAYNTNDVCYFTFTIGFKLVYQSPSWVNEFLAIV